MRRHLTPWLVLVAVIVPVGGIARADTLRDLANAELHLPTVCPADPTVGIYGSVAGALITHVFQTSAQQGGEVVLVERARLEDVLAEHALAPFLDPTTAPAADGLLMAKFLVLAEADFSSLPADLSVSMVRTDTQDVVYQHSSVVTAADGLHGLEVRLAGIAQELASIAAGSNYACPRVGSLSYTAEFSGPGWRWDVAGYFDVVITGSQQALIRHVPVTSQVSGLLVSAADAPFPSVPALTATPQTAAADPQGLPISYRIQFLNPGAPAPNHTLVFDEPPNPVFNTGRQNELEFVNVAAVALGQWMRRDGNPSLQLDARVTGATPITWSVPTGQGAMTLTWTLP